MWYWSFAAGFCLTLALLGTLSEFALIGLERTGTRTIGTALITMFIQGMVYVPLALHAIGVF
jgi:hypothetical protein